jgi:hypothetical protein
MAETNVLPWPNKTRSFFRRPSRMRWHVPKIASFPNLQQTIKETFNVEIMKRITRNVVLDETFASSEPFSESRISSLPSDEVDIHHLVFKASGQFIYASIDSHPLYIQILSQQLDVKSVIALAKPHSKFICRHAWYICRLTSSDGGSCQGVKNTHF